MAQIRSSCPALEVLLNGRPRLADSLLLVRRDRSGGEVDETDYTDAKQECQKNVLHGKTPHQEVSNGIRI